MTTKIVPIVCPESEHNFIPKDIFVPYPAFIGNDPKTQVMTSALLVNKKISLLGISTNKALMGAGLVDNTDCILPSVGLESIVMEFDTFVLDYSIGLSTMPTSRFIPSPNNAVREHLLQFEESMALEFKVGEDQYSASFSVQLLGTLNLQTTNIEVNTDNKFKLHAVYKIAEETVLAESEVYAEAERLLSTAKVLGYTVLAERVNYNMTNRAID